MISKYATTFFAAVALAVAGFIGALAVGPEEAGAQTAPDTVSVTGCTGTSVTLDTIEKRMLDLHNKKRAEKGLKKLCIHPALQKAAEAHSKDMIERDYFSHTSRSGATFAQRVKREGYRYRTAGENIAWGSGSYATPEHRFNGWMNSSGHKANILNKNFREVGIGAAKGTYKSYDNATMWTADFGAR